MNNHKTTSQDQETFDRILSFVRETFDTADASIPLHAPRFVGNERAYVMDAIDSTFVSSVGRYVDKFEQMMAEITGSKYAVAVVNGTSALHVALRLSGVEPGDEVITQPLTFVATANAISYTGGQPVFIDVDRDTLGLSPDKLEHFLEKNTVCKNGECYNRLTSNRIAACVPMHTFGLPARIQEINSICNRFEIPMVEDAAESLGSTFNEQQTGTFGLLGIYSFNGNKTITCGGGGAIVTDNERLAEKAKHITTTAKKNHLWEYIHDEVGYNYRMPNLNAAMACAQLEQLEFYLDNKRKLAMHYQHFFNDLKIKFIKEIPPGKSNYWLNAICLKNKDERDHFLCYSNDKGVMTRPIWRLLNKLEMYHKCETGDLTNAEWLEERIVNIPSSVRINSDKNER